MTSDDLGLGGREMKFELEIRRAVALAFDAHDPYIPEEPEFERTQIMFWWMEHSQAGQIE